MIDCFWCALPVGMIVVKRGGFDGHDSVSKKEVDRAQNGYQVTAGRCHVGPEVVQ